MSDPAELYIGLISGTSIDGIDAAIVDFSGKQVNLLAAETYPINQQLSDLLAGLCQPGSDEINRLGQADHLLGLALADAANKILASSGIAAEQICAIGSHGQTIRHRPDLNAGFTLQIGNPAILCHHTGLPTVADFRRMDMAAGGEGAPLAPAFHQAVFSAPEQHRIILNIGGIANITSLRSGSPLIGFDTGPGNGLMDRWIEQHQHQAFDRNGEWAASGRVIETLLQKAKRDPYFSAPIPKSTGRELFNSEWLNTLLADQTYDPADVQATLLALTTSTIIEAIDSLDTPADAIYVCGGGAHNQQLMQQLQTQAGQHRPVLSTQKLGIGPDWVEAAAFAWLARQRMSCAHGSIASVTGATRDTVLGAIYSPG